MKVEVKAAYFDHCLSRQLNPGEIVDMTKERAAEVCGVFPGIIQEVKEKKAAKKKEA